MLIALVHQTSLEVVCILRFYWALIKGRFQTDFQVASYESDAQNSVTALRAMIMHCLPTPPTAAEHWNMILPGSIKRNIVVVGQLEIGQFCGPHITSRHEPVAFI